jgi:hypothetical protein
MVRDSTMVGLPAGESAQDGPAPRRQAPGSRCSAHGHIGAVFSKQPMVRARRSKPGTEVAKEEGSAVDFATLLEFPVRIVASDGGTTMHTTLSIIKADVGSIGGHVTPSKELLDTVSRHVAAGLDGLLTDYALGVTGDDIAILMTHGKGAANGEVHRLA